MVQIIEESPSFGQQMGRGIGRMGGAALTGAVKGLDERRENQRLKELTGEDYSGLTPEMKKILLTNKVKQKEDINSKFESGIETIGKMREILEKGNVGRFSSIMGVFPGETAEDRAKLRQYGISLIPLVAAGVPIRAVREFEEYKKIITDPSSPISEFKGALDALEGIFKGKINEKMSKSSEKNDDLSFEKEVFDIKNAKHKAKRDQLMKRFNNDRDKVNEILNREFD